MSTYRFRQAVAESFTDPRHRVLLVGEAAHLFPPFGARGMNSGIADADADEEQAQEQAFEGLDGDLDLVTNEFNARPQVLMSDLAQRHR